MKNIYTLPLLLVILLALAFPMMANAQTRHAADRDEPVKLGVQASKRFNPEKLKKAIQNNPNFGSYGVVKQRRNPYADNAGNLTSGAKAPNLRPMKTDFGLKMPQSKYGKNIGMPQPKGLKDTSCFGRTNGKCAQ